MSKSEIEPLKVEKPPEAEPLNDDVMKGVLVDGLSLMTSEYFVILDAILTPPRSGKKPVIAARIIIPPEALPPIIEALKGVAEYFRKESEKEHKKK